MKRPIIPKLTTTGRNLPSSTIGPPQRLSRSHVLRPKNPHNLVGEEKQKWLAMEIDEIQGLIPFLQSIFDEVEQGRFDKSKLMGTLFASKHFLIHYASSLHEMQTAQEVAALEAKQEQERLRVEQELVSEGKIYILAKFRRMKKMKG